MCKFRSSFNMIALRKEFVNVFHQVQKTSSCHQKYVQILIEIYNRTAFEDFVQQFMRCIDALFHEPMAKSTNPLLDRALAFASLFIASLAEPYENDVPESASDEEQETHPLLARVIQETLKYHNLSRCEARFNSCKFLTSLMKTFDSFLDNSLCDSIERAMLERILDPKTAIRLQAITALSRLQEPNVRDCPVINALLECLFDPVACVRKAAVDNIAPTVLTIEKIVNRTGDVDFNVRLAAISKCAMIGPKRLKITQRQHVLLRGFDETNKSVSEKFLNVLIPKWLTIFEGNFLKFLTAVKLDATESDVKQTERICDRLMHVFLENFAIMDIIEPLEIDKDLLVPMDKLNYETVLYWSGLIQYFRTNENMDDYLEQILPELTPFCSYIRQYIALNKEKNMEKWEYIQYEYILYKLFEITETYDLSDEVGRKTLHLLLSDMLKERVCDRLIKKIVHVIAKTADAVEDLVSHLCSVMSDIREPLVDSSEQQESLKDIQFELAQLRVQLDIMNQDMEDAIKEKNFEHVVEVQKKIVSIEEEIKLVTSRTEPKKVKKVQNNDDTVCHYLSILQNTLSLLQVKMCDSLRFCKDECVLPHLENCNPEVLVRALRCVSLYGLLDKTVAREYIQHLLTPIIAYRLTPLKERSIVMVSIAAITDYIRYYGMEILKKSDDDLSSNVTTHSNRRIRRLYQMEQIEDISSLDMSTVEIEDIIAVLLEICDDENSELKKYAAMAVVTLVASGEFVTPTMMSRLLLKWLNPLIAKEEPSITQLLGYGINEYTHKIEASAEVMENAVIPTLTAIANAPQNSPLIDIDIDRAINFLCAITSIKENSNNHKSLMHNLCYNISAQHNDPCVVLFSKMLVHLDMPNDELTKNELITRAEPLLNTVQHKIALKYIQKFIEKLQKSINDCVDDNIEHAENTDAVQEKTADNCDENISTRATANSTLLNNSQRRLQTVTEESLSPDSPIEFSSSGSSGASVVDKEIISNNSKICNLNCKIIKPKCTKMAGDATAPPKRRSSRLRNEGSSQDSDSPNSQGSLKKKQKKTGQSASSGSPATPDSNRSNQSNLSLEGTSVDKNGGKKKNKKHRNVLSQNNCTCTTDISDSVSEISFDSSISNISATPPSPLEQEIATTHNNSKTRRSLRLKTKKRVPSERLSDTEKVILKKRKS